MPPIESPAAEIEFLSDLAEPSDEHDVDAAPGRWPPVLGLLLVVVVGYVAVRSAARTPHLDIDDGEQIDPRPLVTIEVLSDRLAGVDWPENMPQTLIGAPGPQQPVIEGRPDLTLLYVNTLGNPTIVDLDTGDRLEVAVSPFAAHETFFVELGTVVATPESGLNRPPAGDRAVAVHTHRTTRSLPIVGTVTEPGSDEPAPSSSAAAPAASSGGTLPGLWLCLDSPACTTMPEPTLTLGSTDTIRELTSEHDRAVADLFDPAVWRRVGRWMHPPLDLDLDLRLPAPADHAVVWILHQPEP